MMTPQAEAGRTGDLMTYERLWALLQETDLIVKETAQSLKETDQQMKETDRQIKETTQQMKETDLQMKETAQQMKETDKKMGWLTNRFGEVVEHMIVPNLVKRFNELGFTFEKTARNVVIANREHSIFTEIDAFLENGDCTMIVEMKTTLKIKDIVEHIERMKKVRAHADLQNDTRKYYGAVAGVIMGESERKWALKKGFYVIEPSGETFTITAPEGVYTPKSW
ncbi:hypothetical protein LQZ19_12215 [Treponema primitia]|uniref:hypothetical protein n=1 Tax=Treponema primitia TaxID=88058 RepID=UPI003980E65A